MVKTRRQNAKADAKLSKTVFSKEHNDLKIKQVQEYSLHATGQYSLNLFVLGLNDSSTEAEMKKTYHSMAHRFHSDKNIGLDTTEMMKMINKAKDGLEETLRTNDASREEERVRAAEDEIIISSDDHSDSESINTSSKPATPSSKASTLPAKHTNDNAETPQKKTHPRPWTSEKEVLETIKKLYFKCGGNENLEHYTYCLQNGYIYSNMKVLVTKFMKIHKIPAVRQ